jgi:hypothetical protein
VKPLRVRQQAQPLAIGIGGLCYDAALLGTGPNAVPASKEESQAQT